MIKELEEDLKKFLELMVNINKKYNIKILSCYAINDHGNVIAYDEYNRKVTDISLFEDGFLELSVKGSKK